MSAGVGQFVLAQAKLLEKVAKKGNEIVIPYGKYILPNGLTVVVNEDHSDPVVHVDVTYHVGSAREEIGKSGFAHFFERMMFQGSDNVADEQHFKLITESGGTLNGSTNRDRTNYYETVPSNQVEKMLWLEADRMGFLLDAVTKQNQILQTISKNEIDGLSKKYLDMDSMNILLVGDKKKILPGLQAMGYEIIELDADASLVK
jgi:zinc protease